MRCVAISLVLCIAATFLACGSDKSTPSSSGSELSGNWQITLERHAVVGPLTFTGFLQQSGNSVSGSMVLGGGCDGVGPVSGTLEQQNLSLTISEFGEDLNLTGTLPAGGPSASTFVSGPFSSLAGGCLGYASTGTWSAVVVTPLTGKFHGTFVSSGNTLGGPTAGTTLDVSGMLSQGPNTGASNATLAGNMSVTSTPEFCPYLTTASITGLISGTNVTLNLFGPNGSQIGQAPFVATVTANGASLTGSYLFPKISTACPGDTGTMQLTFP